MEVRRALAEQYHAALAMLQDCIQKCPEKLWSNPDPPFDEGDRIIHRAFWRIAYHAVYFTHLYIGPSVAEFKPWPDRRPGYFDAMWLEGWEIEPFEFPADAVPISKAELLAYVKYLDGQMDVLLEVVDLESPESGVPWYKNFPKLNHELLTLRHLQGHVGQLSEILHSNGVDTQWISRVHPFR